MATKRSFVVKIPEELRQHADDLPLGLHLLVSDIEWPDTSFWQQRPSSSQRFTLSGHALDCFSVLAVNHPKRTTIIAALLRAATATNNPHGL
ncbi:MAG: hypothetical protein HQL45_15580 [Alphaproteobacteria bacterium]|nr:hypothetical protein [Alphaproteobacteria bacterium]